MHGGQGIMFTAQVAEELLEGMKPFHPVHFDMWLQRWLEWVKEEPPAKWP